MGKKEHTKDEVLCSALVDKLSHKSYLVNMTGTILSYKRKNINNKQSVTNFLYLAVQGRNGILLDYYLVYFYVIIYSHSYGHGRCM